METARDQVHIVPSPVPEAGHAGKNVLAKDKDAEEVGKHLGFWERLKTRLGMNFGLFDARTQAVPGQKADDLDSAKLNIGLLGKVAQVGARLKMGLEFGQSS